jgi:outer membrane protein assembly factor BamB
VNLSRLRIVCLALTLFCLVGCGDVSPIAKVPDAENSLVTTDGRLFLSGSFNLYEVTKNEDGTFANHPVVDEEYYFMGLDEFKGHLYALRTGKGLNAMLKPEPMLMIADLSAMDPADYPAAPDDLFLAVPLSGMSMPNGLAIDSLGRLFISDTIGGKIYRFDIDPDNPFHVEGPYDCGLKGLLSPNGLAVDGSNLYITDTGTVKKTTISAAGALEPVKTLFSGRIFLDDLTVFQGALVVCDYAGGTLFQLSSQGKILRETKTETFAFPSSVNIGTGPMFEKGDIVVTEKGVLYEPSSDFGNRAVLFHVEVP